MERSFNLPFALADALRNLPDLPACRHACQNLAAFWLDTGMASQRSSFSFSGITDLSIWNPTCYFAHVISVPLPTLTDTILTLRCPYSMEDIDFRPMIAHKDGRFVCRDCAHTVRPGITEYKCTCHPCLGHAKNGRATAVVLRRQTRASTGQC